MKIYIVHKEQGGYAREDAPVSSVQGAYTDEDVARKHRIAIGGKIAAVELNDMPLGISQKIKELGI